MGTEQALEPALPIVDAHHHLWDWRLMLDRLPGGHPLIEVVRHTPRYLLEEFRADAAGGHDVRASVYVECGTSYRSDGPELLRPVGEVEFAYDAARPSEAGGTRVGAGIVGFADLTSGDEVAKTLEAEIEAGRGRLCGVRHMAAHDPDPAVLGPTGHVPAGMLADDRLRRGFAQLRRYGLTFDAWVLEPQLPEVTSLARAFPDVTIVLDHLGTPLDIASYRGRLAARYDVWRSRMRELAVCPNVRVKLGGFGNPLAGMARGSGIDSEQLAERWRPWIVACIEAFGAERCMFESNFPVDRWGVDYVTLWNAFKRITVSASPAEKTALYRDTAVRTYGLDMDDVT